MMNTTFKRIIHSGFTLIELIVVIAIIGLLAAFSTASYMSSLASGRDTQRRSDINQYRIKIEAYANTNNGSYPVAGPGAATSICGTIGMMTCLDDPVTPNNYRFIGTATAYKLYVALESQKTYSWEICSSGTAANILTSNIDTTSAATCP
jgi:prepilin-type N-terminal cleavage/methylation domain-containing protein